MPKCSTRALPEKIPPRARSGRGTIRRMVEGRRWNTAVCDGGPSPTLLRSAVPLPQHAEGGIRLRHFQRQSTVAFVDGDHAPIGHVTAQDRIGERVLDIFLDRALQRPGTVDRIVADPPQPGTRT